MKRFSCPIIEYRVAIIFEGMVSSSRHMATSRKDSINGTPTASWQRPCAIDRVKLKVTKSSVKS